MSNWKDDPRLLHMDKKKIQFLEECSARVASVPPDKRLPFLLGLQKEAARKNISFDDSETLLLVSVLSSGLSPQQKQTIERLQAMRKNK